MALLPPDLRRIARLVREASELAFTSRTLDGRCDVVSGALVVAARTHGYHLDLMYGFTRVGPSRNRFNLRGHYWCVYRGAVVVDLTATQFWRAPRVTVDRIDGPRGSRYVSGMNVDVTDICNQSAWSKQSLSVIKEIYLGMPSVLRDRT